MYAGFGMVVGLGIGAACELDGAGIAVCVVMVGIGAALETAGAGVGLDIVGAGGGGATGL